MVALNTMLAEDGAALHVPPGVRRRRRATDQHRRRRRRLTIRATASVWRKGARLTLVEMSAGQGAYLLNTVAEIHVAEGAHLTHIRLQDEALTAFHVSTTYADVASGRHL